MAHDAHDKKQEGGNVNQVCDLEEGVHVGYNEWAMMGDTHINENRSVDEVVLVLLLHDQSREGLIVEHPQIVAALGVLHLFLLAPAVEHVLVQRVAWVVEVQ